MYKFTPVDSFFFRSSVPFEFAGETSLVETVFPPHPSVYSGAVKDYSTQKRFRIGFSGIALGDEICFPMPLDLLPFNKYDLTSMSIAKPPLSGYPLDYYLTDKSKPEGKIKNDSYLYMKYDCMSQYFNTGTDNTANNEYECFSLSDYIVSEAKIGIALDRKTHIVKDKHLYQIKMLHPKDNMNLVADITNVNIKEDTVIKLGGESKMARVNWFDSYLTIGATEFDSNFFKLYLATPAIFKNGWYPSWIDPKTMCGSFSYKNKSVKIKLIAAVTGKKVAVGGFGYNSEIVDKVKKITYKPKEMRYAVPAGSVYYFKLIKGTFKNAVSLFNQKCISDYREDYGFCYPYIQYNRIKYCDRGFGYSIVGSLNKEQEEMLK